MLDPCCFRKPETELHNFVTVGWERTGKILGIALTRLLCRPLCHDDGWVKLCKRTDDGRDLCLPLRCQYISHSDIVQVLARIRHVKVSYDHDRCCWRSGMLGKRGAHKKK